MTNSAWDAWLYRTFFNDDGWVVAYLHHGVVFSYWIVPWRGYEVAQEKRAKVPDWRSLLVKYMRHIDDREGWFFLSDQWKDEFTEEEWKLLGEIVAEVGK